MEPASRAELKNLMAVLGMNRKQFAEFCMVSANTVGWWLKEEQVPAFRFEDIAIKLGSLFPDPSARSPEQKKAIAFVERIMKAPIAVVAAGGSAKSVDLRSSFFVAVTEKAENQDSKLSLFSLEDLIREIGRRGFKVQIEPRE